MHLIQRLEEYTRFSKGEIRECAQLELPDLQLRDFDFSPFDLNNSYFGGGSFFCCNFEKVYLSGSNFGGSKFVSCKFNCNELVKAEWDEVIMENMEIDSIMAFRATFCESTFRNIRIKNGDFKLCNFWSAKFDKVTFENCNFEQASFTDASFSEVVFKDCILPEKFPKEGLPKQGFYVKGRMSSDTQ